MKLSKQVSAYRYANGLTQYQLAKMAHVSQAEISYVERGMGTEKAKKKLSKFLLKKSTPKVIGGKTKTPNVDPLSLKVVNELQASFALLLRFVLAGFAALALLIVLK